MRFRMAGERKKASRHFFCPLSNLPKKIILAWTRLEKYGMTRGRTPPQINVSEKKKEKKSQKMKIGDKNDLKKLIYGVF